MTSGSFSTCLSKARKRIRRENVNLPTFQKVTRFSLNSTQKETNPTQPKKKNKAHNLLKKNNATQEILLLEAARQLGAPMDLTVDLAAAVDAWNICFPEVNVLFGDFSFPHW